MEFIQGTTRRRRPPPKERKEKTKNVEQSAWKELRIFSKLAIFRSFLTYIYYLVSTEQNLQIKICSCFYFRKQIKGF